MPATNKHGLHAVEIGTGALLGGIMGSNLPTGTEVRGEPTSGSENVTFVSIIGHEPKFVWRTKSLKTAIDLIPVSGKDVSGLTAGLSVFQKKWKRGASREAEASAVHRKLNMAAGVLAMLSMSCDHRGDYELNCEATAEHDGGASPPITISNNIVLPTGAGEDDRFTLGKTTLGGILLTGFTNHEINFGVTVSTESADSDLYPTGVSIEQVLLEMTWQGIDPAWLDDAQVPQTGLPCTHANTVFFLRKRLSKGGYVPDATAQHIKITADGVLFVDEGGSADGNKPVAPSLKMVCRFDGSNAPLVFDTAAAIV